MIGLTHLVYESQFSLLTPFPMYGPQKVRTGWSVGCRATWLRRSVVYTQWYCVRLRPICHCLESLDYECESGRTLGARCQQYDTLHSRTKTPTDLVDTNLMYLTVFAGKDMGRHTVLWSHSTVPCTHVTEKRGTIKLISVYVDVPSDKPFLTNH